MPRKIAARMRKRTMSGGYRRPPTSGRRAAPPASPWQPGRAGARCSGDANAEVPMSAAARTAPTPRSVQAVYYTLHARQHARGIVHLGHQHAVPARRRPHEPRGVRRQRVLQRRHVPLRDPDGRRRRHARAARLVPARHGDARRDDGALLPAVGVGVAVLGVGGRLGAARPRVHVLLGCRRRVARRCAARHRVHAAASRRCSAAP